MAGAAVELELLNRANDKALGALAGDDSTAKFAHGHCGPNITAKQDRMDLSDKASTVGFSNDELLRRCYQLVLATIVS